MEENLIKRMIDSYDYVNYYTELSVEELITGARKILEEKKFKNCNHIAVKFLERAVQKGSDVAKLILAKMYYKGMYAAQDYSKAARYFKELMENNNTQAKRYYADMVYTSIVEDVEREECLKLYEECARDGNNIAKYRLANIYRNGDFAEKPDYEKAMFYYDDLLYSEFSETSIGIIASSCIEAVHCQLENFYLQEANALRNPEYYKRRPNINNLLKRYLEKSNEIAQHLKEEDRVQFESSLEVYRSIATDNSLDISKISYGEFRDKFFKKHPRIFLTTKKTEYLIYKNGLRNYFVMRDDAAEEKEHEVEEKEKLTEKKKTILKKVFSNLTCTSSADRCTAQPEDIEISVKDGVENFKSNYNVDYSLCVTNLDKYLEEIMYQIFVEGLHKYKKDSIEKEINQVVDQINNELTTDSGLTNLVELIVGNASQIPIKNHKKIVEKFIKDILTNRQGLTTKEQIERISNYFNFEESINAQEDFLMNDILYLYETCKKLRSLKIKESFSFGELFNIAFVEQLGDEQNGQTRPNELKMEILDYVLKISNLKDVREVYLKLNELILKLEHFRVMVRNVASHKSVLTQRAIENGLNICITQETSIFNLLDELFGYYLEKQMYIAEVKKYAKNSKTKLTEDEVNNLVNSVMDETI